MAKRYSYIIETLLFSGIVLLIGSLRGNSGFIGDHLHPFYFVILLMVIRYGYFKGFPSILLSGILYITFYLVTIAEITLTDIRHVEIVLSKIGNSGFRINDLWGSCYQPLAFLAFGMFVGLLIEEDKKKIQNLSQSAAEHQRSVDKKNATIHEILAINENISAEIIQSNQSFNILFEHSKHLFSENIIDVYQAAYELLHNTLQNAEGYVFFLEGGQFRIGFPKDAEEKGEVFLSENKDDLENVRRYHKFTRLDTLEAQDLSPESPIFLGPILHQATDTLFGILAVTSLDFSHYNDNSFRTFSNLCKWLGMVLYFRSQQYAATTPSMKKRKEFPFIAKFGSSRADIHKLFEEYVTKE